MLITIIILVLSAVFFVNGKVRSDIVALCALIALLVFQILTPDEALSGFSNSVVIMMIGLFVVGGAIFQTSFKEVMQCIIENAYSRIPIYSGSPSMIGIHSKSPSV